MNTTSGDQVTNEPLPIQQRIRKEGNPAGLVNFGNACYFNSLIQALYHIPEFTEIVMGFNHDEERKKQGLGTLEEESKEGNTQGSDKPAYKYRLLENFQILFGRMIKSEKTYQDARDVFNIIWENNKSSVQNKGDQMDLTEFYIYFHKELFESFEEIQQSSQDDKKEEGKKEDVKDEAKDSSNQDLEMKKNESTLEGDEEMEPESQTGMIFT